MEISAADKARDFGVLTGVIGGLVGRGISLLAPLLVIPEMLKYLGDPVFGVWMTAVSITSMALFVDFGIGNGLLTRLSKAIGKGDEDSARGYIASAYAVLIVVAALLLLCVLMVLILFELGSLGDNLVDAKLDQVGVFLICIIIFIVGVPASVIHRVMYASQKAWLSNVWQVLGAVLSVVACFAAIESKLSPWAIVLSYSLPPVLLMFISAFHFFNCYPVMKPRFFDISKGYAIKLMSVGTGFFALSIVTSSALNLDNVLIAQVLGAEAVTAYAVPAKLASLLGLIVTTLFLPLWAANGDAFARGDYAWVRAKTLRMSFIGGVCVSVAGMILVIFCDDIISLWIGREFQGQENILLCLSLLAVFMAITSPFNMVLNALGLIKVQLVVWLLFLILTVPLKYIALSGGRLWLVPLISAVGYFLIVGMFTCVYVWRHVTCLAIARANPDDEQKSSL